MNKKISIPVSVVFLFVLLLVFLLVLQLKSQLTKDDPASMNSVPPSSNHEDTTSTVTESTDNEVDVTHSNKKTDKWTLKDFENIHVGVSTLYDLLLISPSIPQHQMGRGLVIQYGLEDGTLLEFVCQGDIVCEMRIR